MTLPPVSDPVPPDHDLATLPPNRTTVLPALQWIEVKDTGDGTVPTSADIDAFIGLLDGILRRVLTEASPNTVGIGHSEVGN